MTTGIRCARMGESWIASENHKRMIEYRFDDGGRAAAGYKGFAGDCVARALAIATGEDYKTLYLELGREQKKVSGKRSARNGVDHRAYKRVYEKRGLYRVVLPKGPRPTYSEAWGRHGDCVVSTAKHVRAIVDGCLRDTCRRQAIRMGRRIRPGGQRPQGHVRLDAQHGRDQEDQMGPIEKADIKYVVLDGAFSEVACGFADDLAEAMEDYSFWDLPIGYGILRVDNCELVGTADSKGGLLELIDHLLD